MAAKAISDINENVLLCSVCHERFQTPKTLGCQHSFCLECIEGWVKKNCGVLSCPMCRQTFDVPDKGLVGLPSSYFINQLLEYTADVELGDKGCVMCNASVTAHCMECSSYLCKQCAGNHCKIPSCRGHTVMPLEKYKSMDAKERAAAKPVMCLKHKDVAVEFYCDGCSLPVCMKCTVVSHKGHNLQELETAFEIFKENAKGILSGCSDKGNEIRATLENDFKNTEKQQMSATNCAEQVKRYAETLRKIITDAEKKLLDDLNKRSETILQNRQKKRLVNKEKLDQIQNVSMLLESLMVAPQPTAALFDASEYIKQASKLIGNQQQQQQLQQQPQQQQQNIQAYIPLLFPDGPSTSMNGPAPMWLPSPYQVVNQMNSQITLENPAPIADTKAMSFYFQENPQLKVTAHAIGTIRSQPVNQTKSYINVSQRDVGYW